MKSPKTTIIKTPQKVRSVAQKKVTSAWLAAGRKAALEKRKKQHGKLTPAEHRAVLAWAAAGRAARTAKAHGKKHSPKKPTLSDADSLPMCSVNALAAHLEHSSGITSTPEQIYQLFIGANGDFTGAYLSDVIEAASIYGLSGLKVARFWPLEPDIFIPGAIYNINVSGNYHAVLATNHGVFSWGRMMNLFGTPIESWWIEWTWGQLSQVCEPLLPNGVFLNLLRPGK